jgi:hypothetical protein
VCRLYKNPGTDAILDLNITRRMDSDGLTPSTPSHVQHGKRLSNVANRFAETAMGAMRRKMLVKMVKRIFSGGRMGDEGTVAEDDGGL